MKRWWVYGVSFWGEWNVLKLMVNTTVCHNFEYNQNHWIINLEGEFYDMNYINKVVVEENLIYIPHPYFSSFVH